ncbi:hypothetical protein E2C01_073487 [Portunus trituberculatus]|uniref:Uncharacterized protein n=1 Tax=Portunus trituberculatus TaxID=210409 RepID=A0A5B7IBT5_PORTR|nr:hypothetical protein [Portunus trituberculatus]
MMTSLPRPTAMQRPWRYLNALQLSTSFLVRVRHRCEMFGFVFHGRASGEKSDSPHPGTTEPASRGGRSSHLA